MEILMTNVSIWGILVLLFTTLQMTLRARLQHNAGELSDFINIFLLKAHLFISILINRLRFSPYLLLHFLCVIS